MGRRRSSVAAESTRSVWLSLRRGVERSKMNGHAVQPAFVLPATTRGRDPKAVLSQHDDRNVNLIGSGDLLYNRRHPICKRGKRVGVENLPLVFWFDVLELCLNEALDSAVFTADADASAHRPKPTRAFVVCWRHPVARSSRQRLLHKLLERAPLTRRCGFCFAKKQFWNFKRCFTSNHHPYLWVASEA